MKNNDIYDSFIFLNNLNDLNETEIYQKFNSLKNKGIILNNSFSDNLWVFYDEKSVVNLNFCIDESSTKYLTEYLKLPNIKLIFYFKIYIVYLIGKLALATIKATHSNIEKFICMNPEDLNDNELQLRSDLLYRVFDFVSLIPSENKNNLDNLLNKLDLIAEKNYSLPSSKQRTLSSFNTYFIFDDIVNRFLDEEKDKDNLLFYMPLILWWKITAIIPLRPTEFILTPDDCLRKENNKYYFTIRRSLLKGSKKEKQYKIKSDFTLNVYEIPEKLGKMIEWYKNETSDNISNEIDTLFSRQPYYEHLERGIPLNSRYFTYQNLNTLLRYFYSQIIVFKYKYTILYDKNIKYLPDKTIQFINLGDTRHIAFINLITEGISPLIVAMLGGHDNITTSSHYFSNIVSLIECQTYRLYKKSIKTNQAFSIIGCNENLIKNDSFLFLENNNKCYSSNFINSDYSDCANAIGPNGEIGYCEKCKYYKVENEFDFKANEQTHKRIIENECKVLAELTKKYKQSKCSQSEILSGILKLQDSISDYQDYLLNIKEVKPWEEKEK